LPYPLIFQRRAILPPSVSRTGSSRTPGPYATHVPDKSRLQLPSTAECVSMSSHTSEICRENIRRSTSCTAMRMPLAFPRMMTRVSRHFRRLAPAGASKAQTQTHRHTDTQTRTTHKHHAHLAAEATTNDGCPDVQDPIKGMLFGPLCGRRAGQGQGRTKGQRGQDLDGISPKR
jgi:C4-dicarboxylate-specific signal transduction histidine kinase